MYTVAEDVQQLEMYNYTYVWRVHLHHKTCIQIIVCVCACVFGRIMIGSGLL